MTEFIKLQLPSSLDYIETLLDSVELFLERNDVDSDLIGTLVASLAEAASNAIIHGNHEESIKPIYVDLSLDEEVISLSVEDSNPEGTPGFLSDESFKLPEQKAVHGRGLFIIKTYMDNVTLQKGLHGSRLIMTKRYR
ncbi:MAG TPA: ATP-binding protein [Candidatus Aminicenantes bacterium]|nr:ATP-binding protein [Candidatus Aminicenantes bacterium]